MISIIAALDINGLIGNSKGLPWHLPADLKHFRELTIGKPIIMGRTTHQTIGRPLPERTNIVLTNREEEIPGFLTAHSLEEALEKAGRVPEIMIIGGATVYKQFLPRASRMYLTRINHAFEGDIYFPEYNENEWQEASREEHEPDEKNPYPYAFVMYERQ